jgi:5'-3' exonuclease
MGIPSYYKKLVDTIPGLVSKGHPSSNIQWLFMDFNCLIYHTLYRASTPPYPGNDNREEWESQFLDAIVDYSLKVIKEVGPQKGVYIAIDGVVPMAKMRQQRLRRFKSVWQTQHPQDGESVGSTWDKNSITPGTLFMKKLKTRLETMISKHGKKSWALSSSDEPGEGEHKIISEWRTGKYKGDFAVYGLDADLIVLSILGQESCQLHNNIWLFREEVNTGKISYDDLGEEIFEWFSINALINWLAADFDDTQKRIFILNYCLAMSVLGNDFLPSSLGLKIRDDGHAELLDIVKAMTSKDQTLVNIETLQINFEAIKDLFKILGENEESRIYKFIHKKRIFARNLEDKPKLGDNNWPLAYIEEEMLLTDKKILPNWRDKYISGFFNGFCFRKNDIHRICKEYLYGIQWIWAYYTGKSENVCFNWYYPFNLPPLWSWLEDYLKIYTQLPNFPDKVLVRADEIRPTEQLCLVLPLESWSLIPPCPERALPNLAPQFYPSSFGFDSVGKRYFWECESLIPLPSILEVKEIIRQYT